MSQYSPEIIEAASALLRIRSECDEVLQRESEPALDDSSITTFKRSSFNGALSQPNPGLPTSGHAATYIDRWNSGRAALSSNSGSRRSSTVEARVPELNRPRFTIPHPHQQPSVIVNDTTDDEDEAGEDADVSMQTGSNPMSVTESGGANHHVDAVIDSAGVAVLKDDESRRDGAGTPDSESEKVETDEDGGKYVESSDENDYDDDGKTSKERKGSGDVDVADARSKRRGSKEAYAEQTDDDASDVEVTAWNKRLRTRNAENDRGSNTKTTQQKSSGTMRKGVAVVKKPVAKGRARKGKQTWT